MDESLAEICGIIAGDGHLSRYITPKRTDYKISIAGDKRDLDYFKELIDLFHVAFGVKPRLYEKKNHLELRIDSKKILEKIEKIGIPAGEKSSKVRIPKIIIADLDLSRAFVRGFADTDFSLILRKNKYSFYPRITVDIKSAGMLEDLCNIFQKLNMTYCGPYNRSRIRNGVPYVTYQLDLNGRANFKIWMEKIGFRNPKHLNKVKKIKSPLPDLNTPISNI